MEVTGAEISECDNMMMVPAHNHTGSKQGQTSEGVTQPEHIINPTEVQSDEYITSDNFTEIITEVVIETGDVDIDLQNNHSSQVYEKQVSEVLTPLDTDHSYTRSRQETVNTTLGNTTVGGPTLEECPSILADQVRAVPCVSESIPAVSECNSSSKQIYTTTNSSLGCEKQESSLTEDQDSVGNAETSAQKHEEDSVYMLIGLPGEQPVNNDVEGDVGENLKEQDPIVIVEFADNHEAINDSSNRHCVDTSQCHNSDKIIFQAFTDFNSTASETGTLVADPNVNHQHKSTKEQIPDDNMLQTTVVAQDSDTMMEYRKLESELECESSTSVSSSDDDTINPRALSNDDKHGNRCGRGGYHDDVDDEAGDLDNKKGRRSLAQSLIKTKGELFLEDLPPIDELTITVGDDVNMVQAGHISSIIDSLVIVQSSKGLPPLNIDTVLFLDGKKVLGQVFETFGPVAVPLYSVRFNSQEQIGERCVETGLAVYYAPDAPEYTHYVFMAHLQRIKGSDASWEHNNEPPAQFVEYSDDEEERRVRKDLEKERRRHRDGEVSDGNTGRAKHNRRKPHHDSSEQKEGTLTPRPTERANFQTNVWPPKNLHSHRNGTSDSSSVSVASDNMSHGEWHSLNEGAPRRNVGRPRQPHYRDPRGRTVTSYGFNSEPRLRGTSPWSRQDRLPQRHAGPHYNGPPYRGAPPNNRGPPAQRVLPNMGPHPTGATHSREPPPPGVAPPRGHPRHMLTGPTTGPTHHSAPCTMSVTNIRSQSTGHPSSDILNASSVTMAPPANPSHNMHTGWPPPVFSHSGAPPGPHCSPWNQPHSSFTSPPPQIHSHPPPAHTSQPPHPGHNTQCRGHDMQPSGQNIPTPPPGHNDPPPNLPYHNAQPPFAMYSSPPPFTPPNTAPFSGPGPFSQQQQQFGGRPQFPHSSAMSFRPR